MKKENKRFMAYDMPIARMSMPCPFFFQYYSDIPKDAKVLIHSHQIVEFLLVTSGRVSISVEGVLYDLEEGDIFIVQPDLLHRTIILTPDRMYTRHVIHLEPDFVRSLISASRQDPEDMAFLLQTGAIHCKPTDTFKLQRLIEQMHSLYEEMPSELHSAGGLNIRVPLETPPYVSAQRALIECELLEMLLYLSLQHKAQRRIAPRANPLATRAIEYINENYTDPDLSLQSVAADLFVSEGYLARIFKAYTGSSLYSYVIRKRLIYAQKLLQEDVNITDTCQQCGFRDYTAFLKAFRTAFDIAPKRYQELCRESSRGLLMM